MKIRKLSISDKAQVLAISAQIWENTDYYQHSFDKWVTSESGLLVGAFDADKLIGFGRATWISPHDVWLQGLCKDPVAPHKGIARLLSKYFLDTYLAVPHVETIRFSTYFGNLASIYANLAIGFQLLATLSFMETDNVHVNKTSLPVKQVNTLDTATINSILNSEFIRASAATITSNWVSYPCTLTHLAMRAATGEAYTCGSADKMRGMMLLSDKGSLPVYTISYIDYDSPEVLNTLLNKAKEIAGDINIEIFLPPIPRLIADFKNKGFKSMEKEADYLIYEYRKNNQ